MSSFEVNKDFISQFTYEKVNNLFKRLHDVEATSANQRGWDRATDCISFFFLAIQKSFFPWTSVDPRSWKALCRQIRIKKYSDSAD